MGGEREKGKVCTNKPLKFNVKSRNGFRANMKVFSRNIFKWNGYFS